MALAPPVDVTVMLSPAGATTFGSPGLILQPPAPSASADPIVSLVRSRTAVRVFPGPGTVVVPSIRQRPFLLLNSARVMVISSRTGGAGSTMTVIDAEPVSPPLSVTDAEMV